MEIRAFLLKTIVAPRLVGLVNLAKKMPAIMAEMMTPVILWMHMVMMAKEHRPVVALPPYLYMIFIFKDAKIVFDCNN